MGLGVLSQYTQLILGPPLVPRHREFGLRSLECSELGVLPPSFLVTLGLMGERNTS